MNITPCLGIGDLLIVKMIQISNNLEIKNININEELIQTHSENFEQKLNTVKKLIELLFSNTTYCTNNIPIDFTQLTRTYNIKYTYIYDYIDTSNLINITSEYSDYIIFHTKLRHDLLITQFCNDVFDNLKHFFSTFVTSKKIIILGERVIGKNFETITHGTMSLYDVLLLLKNNNCVVDLTHHVLTCGNSDFDKFLFDIHLIHKSLCNVTFGIGGPFGICKAFSKNNVSFIPFYESSPSKKILDQMNMEDNTVVETVAELKNMLESRFT